MEIKKVDEMRAHIIKKASEDEAFRATLVAEPKATIEGELGVTIPDGVTVQVHENTTQHVHLVLPPTGKLSEKELTAAGGDTDVNTGISACSCDTCWYCVP